jgi:hypothetical protein
MPDAVPGQHEIIFSWRISIADILVVKQNMRMALPGQVDHPFGNVNPFHQKPVQGQKVDKAPTALAAYIESKAARVARAALDWQNGEPAPAEAHSMIEDATLARYGQWHRNYGRSPSYALKPLLS